MGFIMLGIYSFNEIAIQGVVMQMIAHGISIGALFIIAGSLSDRIHTRELTEMGGLWSTVPRMGALGLIFVLASLGLPGLGNFIAEILILIGSFAANHTLTIIAATGMVAATIYSLRIMQKVFFGEKQKEWKIPDFGFRELTITGSLAVVIIWLGLFPSPVLHLSEKPVQKIIDRVNILQPGAENLPERKNSIDFESVKNNIGNQLIDDKNKPLTIKE
jgi:NADH-quinone oxidoreductase subunit M